MAGQRVSPVRLPWMAAATLVRWQGGPPATTSASTDGMVLASWWTGMPGQCFASTRRQRGSISQKATVWNPARSNPRDSPPIPLKRSSRRILLRALCRGQESPTLVLQLHCVDAHVAKQHRVAVLGNW